MAMQWLDLTVCEGAEFVLGAQRNLRVKVEVGFGDPDAEAKPVFQELGETEACLTISQQSVTTIH